MILIDSHVHVYNCSNQSALLDAAENNFKRHIPASYGEDVARILLLTNRSGQAWPQIFSSGEAKNDDRENVQGWHFNATREPESVIAENEAGVKITIIAGRQLVSSEGLEVLALLTLESFQEGVPAEDLIVDINLKGGIAVVPWAFGKWFGKRYRVIRQLQEKSGKLKFFFGDNGNRPWCIPLSPVLQSEKKQQRIILSGSDPLPLAGEELRVGSFGVKVLEKLDYHKPAEQLRTFLERQDIDVFSFGKTSGCIDFVRKQCALRGILR